ncbi:MAG: hypothetical protein HYT16_02420 [DPANN group archaeon]|nr:hypothetical protein [DPANN group archaeon]
MRYDIFRVKTAQSFTEFLIAAFLFLIIVSAVFITVIRKSGTETERAADLTSFQKASILSTIALRDTGPISWQNSPGLPAICGLGDGNGHVLLSKWLRFSNYTFDFYGGCLGINTTWQASYAIRGFPDSLDTNAACTPTRDRAVICRFANGLGVYVNTSNNAILDAELFFPNATSATVTQSVASPLEANDVATTDATPDGIKVVLQLRTSAGDRDNITILAVPWNTTAVKSIYFKSFDNLTDINVTIGDVKILDSIGVQTSARFFKPNFAEIRRGAAINNTNTGDLFPAVFKFVVWR